MFDNNIHKEKIVVSGLRNQMKKFQKILTYRENKLEEVYLILEQKILDVTGQQYELNTMQNLKMVIEFIFSNISRS